MSEFLQLFPEEGDQRISPALSIPAAPLRLTLADRTWLRTSRVQVIAAIVDLVMVAVITAAVAWWMPVAAGTVAAIVTVIYYSLATACLACTQARGGFEPEAIANAPRHSAWRADNED